MITSVCFSQPDSAWIRDTLWTARAHPDRGAPLGTVTVAVATYRRPELLATLLPPLLAQVEAAGATLLVVDNDPAGSARDTVAASPAARYVHEPVPGIAAARNRALDEARTGGAAALVFLDDDEQPEPGWLDGLVARWRDSAATAVTGPVEPDFAGGAAGVDPWIRASLRFERRDHPDGALLRSAATNNLLLDLAAVDRLGLRFDESFGLTGGEDTDFTHELVARGGLIVWCAGAVVRDRVPAERLTRAWVLRREFRSGTSWSRMRLVHAAPAARPAVRAGLALRGVARAAGALVRLTVGIATGNVSHRARGACLAAGNAGLVAGALGYRYGEYRRSS